MWIPLLTFLQAASEGDRAFGGRPFPEQVLGENPRNLEVVVWPGTSPGPGRTWCWKCIERVGEMKKNTHDGSRLC